MSTTYDVVIAGAGPVGLFLACELALANVSVIVLEREVEPHSTWKVKPLGLRGLNTLTNETIYRRGLQDKFYTRDERPEKFERTSEFKWAGHFAGIGLDMNKLDVDSWKYRIPGPALFPGRSSLDEVEIVFAERAESLGVKVLRGHGVNSIIAQDSDSVTVDAGPNHVSFRGKWLVGCDGGRSQVRHSANFDFVGSEPKMTGYALLCDLEEPGKLPQGFYNTNNGMVIKFFPELLHIVDYDGGAFDRTQTLTLERVQEKLNFVRGNDDVVITNLQAAATFTDRARLVTTYRKSRILLCGDAAHVHAPFGAQGLNLGLGDAMNLGWKLAATVKHEAKQRSSPTAQKADCFSLLDTYEHERSPVAARVLDWARAQSDVLEPGPYGRARYSLMCELAATRDGNNHMLEQFWGHSLRYPPTTTTTTTTTTENEQSKSEHHPLVGMSAPDFQLIGDNRSETGHHSWFASKLVDGRGVLADLASESSSDDDNDSTAEMLKTLVVGTEYDGRVKYMRLRVKDARGLRAVLVRPDGFVAWAAEGNTQLDVNAAKAALEKWFAI